MFKGRGQHVPLPREVRWSPLYAVEAVFVMLAALREARAASSRQGAEVSR